MSKYRHRLPQLRGELFLTDGGLETTLVFHEGLALPYFAAFDLLKDDAGIAVLRAYFDRYAAIARTQGAGLLLETPTWRANPDWAAKLGYDTTALADANRRAVGLLLEVRTRIRRRASIVISGNLGPRGDGYQTGARMSAAEAEAYHAPQIGVFAETDADMVAAFTMNYAEEAIGIVRAASAAGMPVAIVFHARDRRPAALRRGARPGDHADRRRDRRCARLLHDQLRASDALRRRAPAGRRLARASPWAPGQRLPAEPCGAGRESGPRRGDPDELARQYDELRAAFREADCGWGMLRHGPSPRGGDWPRAPAAGRRGSAGRIRLTQQLLPERLPGRL